METAEGQGAYVKPLAEQPELMPGLDFYLNAYRDLLTDRFIGMGAGPIPWTSIHRWAVANGITDYDDFEAFQSHIRALERADREFEEEKK